MENVREEVKPRGRGKIIPRVTLPERLLCSITEPTLLHITHPKAGSQWIHRILLACVGSRIVTPEAGQEQFFERPLVAGKVYPTLYVTKMELEAKSLPPNLRRFVIIRDLRDCLISGYFSLKYSHPVISPLVADWRTRLQTFNLEDGLLALMKEWLPISAAILQSWCEAGEPVTRYEDLLTDDLAILSRLLLDHGQLKVSRQRFAEIVLANRFERLTHGLRARGKEDLHAHERKGSVGDWRNYFTPRIKQEFKACYGNLLMLTGYEQDLYW